MYLDIWMIVALVVAFGFCATYNRSRGYKNGFHYGGIATLGNLMDKKIIKITETGDILKHE